MTAAILPSPIGELTVTADADGITGLYMRRANSEYDRLTSEIPNEAAE